MDNWILFLGQGILAHQITVSLYYLYLRQQTGKGLQYISVNAFLCSLEATLVIVALFLRRKTGIEYGFSPYFSSFILFAILVLILQNGTIATKTVARLLSLLRLPTIVFFTVSILLYGYTFYLAYHDNLLIARRFSYTSQTLMDMAILGYISGMVWLNKAEVLHFQKDMLFKRRDKIIRFLIPLSYLLYYVIYRYIFYKWSENEHYMSLVFYLTNSFVAFLLLLHARRAFLSSTAKAPQAGKYKRNKLNLSLQQDYYKRIRSITSEKGLFLNPDLTITELSDEVGIPVAYISQVLNTFHERGFYGFINAFRMEKVVSILDDANPDHKLNISAIAMESGFNSMTTFYKTFKETIGTTPKDYLKRATIT